MYKVHTVILLLYNLAPDKMALHVIHDISPTNKAFWVIWSIRPGWLDIDETIH